MSKKAHSVSAGEASMGASILSQLYNLAGCEADEPEQLDAINQAISSLSRWLELERMEIGTPGDVAEAREAYGPMKAWTLPSKAEELTTSQADAWLAGKRSRRILVVPFGGPLPGGKAGLDLDGEYFDEATDLVGPWQQLRATRERLVDWHHDGDPTGVMKGAILGKIVLDPGPEQDGVWADFWANAGEKRRQLVAQLEQRGIPLYGSSQAEPTTWRKADDGHIEVWPIIRHTITTSPQNIYAVVPPLKALLGYGTAPEGLSVEAIHAAMLGADGSDPLQHLASGPGNVAGTAGRDAKDRLSAALDQLSGYLRGLTG